MSFYSNRGNCNLDRNDSIDDNCRCRNRCDNDNSCGNNDSVRFCTTGRGILFGISMGDRVYIRVRGSIKELCVVFQGIAGDIALFTNGDAGTGLLRVPLDNILTVRVK